MLTGLFLGQTTVSVVVPTCGKRPLDGILVVEFNTKHRTTIRGQSVRGVGIPGERWDPRAGTIEYHALAALDEELGLPAAGCVFQPNQFRLLCIRQGIGRDVRRSVGLAKVNHENPLPRALEPLPKDVVDTDHRPDFLLWVDHNYEIDPRSLKPTDCVEVAQIRNFAFAEADRTRLPISDDRAALHYFRDLLTGATKPNQLMTLPEEYLERYQQLPIEQ